MHTIISTNLYHYHTNNDLPFCDVTCRPAAVSEPLYKHEMDVDMDMHDMTEPHRDVFIPSPIVYRCKNEESKEKDREGSKDKEGSTSELIDIGSCAMLSIRPEARDTALLRLSMPVGSLADMESVHLTTMLIQYGTFAMLMLVLFIRK